VPSIARAWSYHQPHAPCWTENHASLHIFNMLETSLCDEIASMCTCWPWRSCSCSCSTCSLQARNSSSQRLCWNSNSCNTSRREVGLVCVNTFARCPWGAQLYAYTSVCMRKLMMMTDRNLAGLPAPEQLHHRSVPSLKPAHAGHGPKPEFHRVAEGNTVRIHEAQSLPWLSPGPTGSPGKISALGAELGLDWPGEAGWPQPSALRPLKAKRFRSILWLRDFTMFNFGIYFEIDTVRVGIASSASPVAEALT